MKTNMKRAQQVTCMLLCMVLASVTSCSLFMKEETEEKQTVQALTLSSLKETLFVSEERSVHVSVDPIGSGSVSYRIVNTEIASVVESSNNGIVVKGNKKGKTTIVVKAGEKTAFCELEVQDATVIEHPVIVVPSLYYALAELEKITIQPTLYGGTEEDNSLFSFVCKNTNIAQIEYVQNVCVVQAVSQGTTEVEITNPKAKYSQRVLVSVGKNNVETAYITTEKNVVQCNIDEGIVRVPFSVVGVSVVDVTKFTYTILEGAENISIQNAGSEVLITGIEEGVSTIQAMHKDTMYPVAITVVITKDITNVVLDATKEFVLLQNNASDLIKFSVHGDTTTYTDFTWTIDNPELVSIVKINNGLLLQGTTSGTGTLTVTHSSSKAEKNIFIVVENDRDYLEYNDRYIKTYTPLVELEEGDEPKELTMFLIGGNEADKNNFTWVVEDKSICEVETTDGTVQYTRSISGESSYTAKAYIKPKKSGICSILVKHPKSKTETTVVVKVYPTGTFNDMKPALYIPGDSITVEKGNTVSVALESNGGFSDYSTVQWKSVDETIITVEGMGKNAVIRGIASGITKIRIEGEGFKEAYDKYIICTDSSAPTSKPYIYADPPKVTIAKGQYAYIELASTSAFSEVQNQFTIVSDGSVCTSFILQKTLVIKGVQEGSQVLRISNIHAENSIEIQVLVKNDMVSLDYPYEITIPTFFISLVKGESKEYSCSLVHAPDDQKSGLTYSVENQEVISVTGAGEYFHIDSKESGESTLYIQHEKVKRISTIHVTVYNTREELQASYPLYVSVPAIQLVEGETRFVFVETQRNVSEDAKIQWTNSNTQYVTVDSFAYYAKIDGIHKGSSTIEITHPSGSKKTLYVSVVSKEEMARSEYVNCDSIVRITKNQTVIRRIDTNIAEEHIEVIPSDGIQASVTFPYIFIKGDTKGTYPIRIRSGIVGIEKEILVIVDEEGSQQNVLYSDSTSFTGTVYDTFMVVLKASGQAGAELALQNSTVVNKNPDIIRVLTEGSRITVEAVHEGIGVIEITNSSFANTVVCTFFIKEKGKYTTEYTMESETGKKVLIQSVQTQKANIKDVNGVEQDTRKGTWIWTVLSGNAELVANESVAHIKPISSGYVYIRVYNTFYNCEKTIVYIVVSSEEKIQSTYGVYAAKKHYFSEVHTPVQITLIDTENNISKQNNITWSVGSQQHISVSNTKGISTDIVCTEEGIYTVEATHPEIENPIQCMVYITKDVIQKEKENIYPLPVIVLTTGETRNYTVQNTVLVEHKNTISWHVSDTSVIATNAVQGESVYLYGIQKGYSYVTVSYQGIEKTILVIVKNTSSDVYAGLLVNDPNRVLLIGQTGVIEPDYVGDIPITTDTTYTPMEGSDCVAYEVKDGKLLYEGLREGVATFAVKNTGCINEQILTLSVRKKETVEQTLPRLFMKTEKPYHLLEMTDSFYMISVTTVKELYDIDREYVWTCADTSIINVESHGSYSIITPKKIGKTTILISNIKCENSLQLVVEVGDKTTVDGKKTGYMRVSQSVYFINTLQDIVSVHPEFVNMESSDYKKTVFENKTPAIIQMFETASDSPFVEIKPLAKGTGVIEVRHPDSVNTVYLTFYINQTNEVQLPYLTTAQNSVIVQKGKVKQVSVSLMHYNEPNGANISWSVDQSSVVYIIGEGNTVQFYGASVGTATAYVKHPFAQTVLPIHVQVVDEATYSENVYITSTQNMIETVVSDTMIPFSIQLYGSYAVEKITYTSDDDSIISVVGQGEQAFIKAKKEGIASVTVNHPECSTAFKCVVLVSKLSESEYFISTDTKILSIKPNTKQTSVRVALENGSLTDVGLFDWKIYTQNVAFKDGVLTSGKVIDIVGNGNQAQIQTYNSGVAVIRVSHPKAVKKLDITVYVTENSNVTFEKESVKLIEGNLEFVTVFSPTYDKSQTIVYTSENPSVCTAYGSNEVCAISAVSEGVTKIIASDTTGKTSELLVTVEKKDTTKEREIVTNRSMYIMNTRSPTETIRAYLSGGDYAYDYENDTIQWTVNDPTGILSIYPAKTNGYYKGREIQLTPTGVSGLVTVTASHSSTSLTKTILVQVNELNNFFTLDKTSIQTVTGEVVELRAKILNGRINDYSEIVWSATKKVLEDGSYKDIVTIMGSGEKISLFTQEAGITYVTAFYKGEVRECVLVVDDQYIFEFNAGSIRFRPGSEHEVDIGYTVKPVDANIIFTKLDSSANSESFSFIHDPVKKVVHLIGYKEGSGTLTGRHNGVVDTLNVTVKDQYRVIPELLDVRVDMNYDVKNTVDIPFILEPETSDYDIVLGNIAVRGQEKKADQFISYTVTKGDKGKYTIHLTGLKEFTFSGTPTVTIQQYKDSTKSELTGEKLSYYVQGSYTKANFNSYFVKHSGRFSNTEKNFSKYSINDKYKGSNPTTDITSYSQFSSDDKLSSTNGIYLADGETSYILIQDALALSNNEVTFVTLENSKNMYTAQVDRLDNGVQLIRLQSSNDVQNMNRVVFENIYGYEYKKEIVDEKEFNITETDLFDKFHDTKNISDIYGNTLTYTGKTFGAIDREESEKLWQSMGYAVQNISTRDVYFKNFKDWKFESYGINYISSYEQTLLDDNYYPTVSIPYSSMEIGGTEGLYRYTTKIALEFSRYAIPSISNLSYSAPIGSFFLTNLIKFGVFNLVDDTYSTISFVPSNSQQYPYIYTWNYQMPIVTTEKIKNDISLNLGNVTYNHGTTGIFNALVEYVDLDSSFIKYPTYKYKLSKNTFINTIVEPSVSYYENNHCTAFEHDYFAEGSVVKSNQHVTTYAYPQSKEFTIPYKTYVGFRKATEKYIDTYKGGDTNFPIRVYVPSITREDETLYSGVLDRKFNTNGAEFMRKKNPMIKSDAPKYDEETVLREGYNEFITVTKKPYVIDGKKQFESKDTYFGKGNIFEQRLKEGVDYNFYPTDSLVYSKDYGKLIIKYTRFDGTLGEVSYNVIYTTHGCNRNYDPANAYATSFYKD